MVLGINADTLGGETTATIQQFMEQTGITFPVGRDSGSYNLFRTAGGSGLSPYPLDVVIDRDGIIRYVSREYDATAVQDLIETLLAQ